MIFVIPRTFKSSLKPAQTYVGMQGLQNKIIAKNSATFKYAFLLRGAVCFWDPAKNQGLEHQISAMAFTTPLG